MVALTGVISLGIAIAIVAFSLLFLLQPGGVVGQQALEGLFKQYAGNVLGQYEVTYRRPAGAAAKYVQVGVMRNDLKPGLTLAQ